MTDQKAYDVAILGGGPGGYGAALRASANGLRACCVEQGLLGGTCLNTGCIPTKAMLHASDLAWKLREARSLGLEVGGEVVVNAPAYMQRVKDVTSKVRKGLETLMSSRRIEIINGHGRLAAADAISVRTPEGERIIKARAIVIATGSRPARPGFVPWDSPHVWTTEEATVADDLPDSVVLMGGGVIGCEFATMYGELGIKVTVVEMLDRLVAPLDDDASRAISRRLQRRGIEVKLGAEVTGVSADESGVIARLAGGDEVSADRLLVAVGRRPNVENIGLEELGVAMSGGVIKVDDRCRTSVEGVYAVGDVAEKRQYAHLATRMGIVAADNIAGLNASDDRAAVPEVIYGNPEVATVGLSETAARERAKELRSVKIPMSVNAMAHCHGLTEGFVKLFGDAAGGELLGAVAVGLHASDFIQELTLALKNRVTIQQIAETMHAHPTLAETVSFAAESWIGRPVLTLR